MRILVTGGAGFIGSNLIGSLLQQSDISVLNIDKLTFPGSIHTLSKFEKFSNYTFIKLDICDDEKLDQTFTGFNPDIVMHLAAESHVDRSIDAPAAFIQSNIIGTYNLLKISKYYWDHLPDKNKHTFRFHHISTDEVFGSLKEDDEPFCETDPYQPNSPYSASKASSDHLVRAWYHTYGLPVIISSCSNNYGPYQFPEKLIPLMIIKALNGEPLPVYGDGMNIRDWLYVEDHVTALVEIAKKGNIGETYNIGGNSERSNINVVNGICEILDELIPDSDFVPHNKLISFVDDRPGHDQRYAMNINKIKNDLGWSPKYTFSQGLRKTVTWYLQNIDWCTKVQQGQYSGERLGQL